MMDMPPAFRNLLMMFHQDIFILYSNDDEVAEQAIGSVIRNDAPAVRAFLDELTSGRYSPQELETFWREAPTDVFIQNGEAAAALFRLLRDKLDVRFPPTATG